MITVGEKVKIVRLKVKIDNGIWLCYDSNYCGKGSTPYEAWCSYERKKEFDKLIERMYNYVEVMG